ncbi:MAG: hypothetical protein E7290_01255 [Lachnospiraceae bacterium]|nr:hypothetical protein [Lachnospiraceae bacterium]
MMETVKAIWEDIVLYNGDSFLFVLFLAVLLVLCLVEKDKGLKTILVYLSVALIVVFMNPLYAWIAMKVDDEVYYRVWWTLPIGIGICYCVVKAAICVRNLVSKILVVVLAVIVIVINGKFVYTNTIYFKASNAYHTPQMVIDVAEAVRMENYNPKAVFPAELLPFIRQYTAEIIMPYGRNMVETRWGFSSPLYDCMEADVYVAEDIAKYAREEICVYVVLSSIKPMEGKLEDYHYTLQGLVSGYYIYMDDYCYEILKEQGYIE